MADSGPTDYRALLAKQRASVPQRAARTLQIYRQYRDLIDRYRGGMPAGLLAARIQWESDGRMDAAGMASIGEFGVLQVAAGTEADYGLPLGYRQTLEHNVFLAALDYNAQAQRLSQRYPGLLRPGSLDHWLVAQLPFSIGIGATVRVLTDAKPTPGDVMPQLVAWAQGSGPRRIGQQGTQSPEKVAYRIMVKPLLVQIARTAGVSVSGSVPELPPLPDDTPSVRLPADIRATLKPASGPHWGWWLLGAAAAVRLAAD